MESKVQGTGSRRGGKRKWIAGGAAFIICGALFFGLGWKVRSHAEPSPGSLLAKGSLSSAERTGGLTTTLQHEKVDVIGGSMAHGWLDPHNNSYLRRAMAARSASTNTAYDYIDHTVVGDTPYMVEKKGEFKSWLNKDHPQIVLLSWGILNSMSSRHRTTLDQFANAVHQEISMALKAHAVVLIVTPPVTEESAVNDHAKQEVWINHLFQEAASFKSKNVYTIDLYHQMEAYMQAHGQTYKDYYGNSWHPNQAGHILAGSMLANDLVQTFGLGPIHWR